MSKGLVSATQIALFENKMDFVVTTKNRVGNTKLFYYMSKGHGMLKLVDAKKVADKKEGFVELYNADEFVGLANKYGDLKGYISANTYKKHSQNPASQLLTKKELKDRAENYLYNEINQKVLAYLKSLPTEIDIKKLYDVLGNFKNIYNELNKLPKIIVFDYDEYGFSDGEKKKAKEAIEELLGGVAQELGFTLLVNTASDNTVGYLLAGAHNMLQRQPTVVFKKVLQAYCLANVVDDKNFVDFALQLYNANKSEFTSGLIASNYYKGIVGLIGDLDKEAKAVNLVGLKDWFEYATSLETNKNQLIAFVKGEEQQ